MEELLEKHFAGAGTRELAVQRGCSHETVAKDIREAKREHILAISGELLLARRSGEVLWFVMPAQSGPEMHAALRYFDWVVSELEDLTIRTQVEVKTLPDGSVALGLTELTEPEEAER